MTIEPQVPVSIAAEAPAERTRASRIWVMLFVIFCFEIGLFLLVFPWLDPWDNNGMADMRWFSQVWDSTYFRGALSGLGLVNIYISMLEVYRLKRALG